MLNNHDNEKTVNTYINRQVLVIKKYYQSIVHLLVSHWCKLRGSLLMGIGYMLSPLSWWNDVFFNLPIALLFAYLISWIKPGWFFQFTIIGYWLSNVLGIAMMQVGAMDMFFDAEKRNLKRDLFLGLGGSTLYTIVVTILVYWHILEVPDFLLELQ